MPSLIRQIVIHSVVRPQGAFMTVLNNRRSVRRPDEDPSCQREGHPLSVRNILFDTRPTSCAHLKTPRRQHQHKDIALDAESSTQAEAAVSQTLNLQKRETRSLSVRPFVITPNPRPTPSLGTRLPAWEPDSQPGNPTPSLGTRLPAWEPDSQPACRSTSPQ